MKQNNFPFLMILVLLIISCNKEKTLNSDFDAPTNLPPGVVAGTPLNDAVLKLFKETGIVVYKDTGLANGRFTRDLVSNDALSIAGKRTPADTAAALLYIRMIKEEFYDLLPENKKSLAFRNFFLIKNPLVTGSGSSKYTYDAHLWYNSNADVTMGSLNNVGLDTNLLKASFFYALSNRFRNSPENGIYFTSFNQLKEDWGVYYWQVSSQDMAYEYGFLSGDQSRIISNQQDFDLFASWIVITPPEEREELLDQYDLLKEKYQIVSNMFKKEGIVLEEINLKWMNSPLRP